MINDDLLQRAEFLSSGQNDPHSTTITELVATIRKQQAALNTAANALEDAGLFVEAKQARSALKGEGDE